MTDETKSSALAAAKEELEIAKIKLEIADLSKPWWQRFTVSAPFATIFVAIIGYVTVFQTGYFDQRRIRLDKEVTELTLTKEKLTNQNAYLGKSIRENAVIFKASLVKYLTVANLEVMSYIFVPFEPREYCNVGKAAVEGNILIGGPFESSGFAFSAYFFRHIELPKAGMSATASKNLDGLLETLASEFEMGSHSTFKNLMAKHNIEEFGRPFGDLSGPMELEPKARQILCDHDQTANFSVSEIETAKAQFEQFSGARATFSLVVEGTFRILAAEVSLMPASDLFGQPEK
ncbi:hypothetical protein GFM02_32375 [Rhizobium leguminosarum bv. viciae]|uniref:hypothetical protein n=1 Tax=Rhizobium leguminosarum TaxID=384 RepID=UPI00144231F9|nr:hypothetical protein [Rhizobium leguminosarum]NKL02808.1 hypothetical protein [Rhizobium leguminosarum bv. viciae]